MKNLCIIPARGGSKRIPRKNIKDFLGKPIIAYSIQVALESNLFDEVMVSTDDKEIAEIAERFGAKIPFFRSTENSNDHATTLDVISEVINMYKSKLINFDNICCLYPCAPLVSSIKLKEAYNLLSKKNYWSVLPIVRFSFPIQRAFKINDDKVKYLHPEYENVRSQDLDASYHDAGQFYWAKVEVVFKNTSFFTDNTGYLELDEILVQDIDNESDWKLAEMKYELL